MSRSPEHEPLCLHVDVRWRAGHGNSAWERATGQTSEEMWGWGWIDAVHPDDRYAVLSQKSRNPDPASASSLRYRLRRADGSWAWVSLRVEGDRRAAAHSESCEGEASNTRTLVHEHLGPAADRAGHGSLPFSWTTVADQVSEGFIAADAAGEITYVNRAAREMHGIDVRGVRPDEYTDHYGLFTMDGEPYPPHDLPLARAAEHGEAVRGARWRVRRPDGDERVLEGEAVPILEASGEQSGSLLTCRDVTTEWHLREREVLDRQLLEQVFEESPVFKAVLEGPDHRFVRANPAYRRLVGERELVGRTVADALPEVVPQGFLEILDEVYRTGEPYRARERPVLFRPDTEAPAVRRTLDFTYQPLRNSRGRVTGILAVGVDVTAQVEARLEEERLRARLEASLARVRERDRRFREIADNVDGVIWTSTPDKSRIEYLSPAYERIWGRSRADVYADADRFLEAVHPDDRERVVESFREQTRGTLRVRYRIVRPDGEVRWIQTRSSPVREDDGDVVRIVGVSEDVTTSVALERRYRTAVKMEALGQMASRIAHDFNNIITSTSGLASIVRDALPEGTDAHSDVSEILSGMRRAGALTAQLLAFGRRDDGPSTAVEANRRIHGLRRMIEMLIGEKTELVVEVDDAEAWVECLPSEIDQIVINLASNAAHAMPEGGRLTVRTRLHDPDPGGETTGDADAGAGRAGLELEVVDTGTGIAPEVRERIFEPLFTTKAQGEGTGLGLSTVANIVSNRGGEIEVESRLGHGTLFRIRMPTVRVEPEVAGPELSEAPARATIRNARVLVVDDDGPLRSVMVRSLRRSGLTVHEAASPEAAVDFVCATPTPMDLLVSDVVMPGMKTGDMLEHIRAEHPDVRVLLTSGYQPDQVDEHGIGVGERFLAKPFELSDLLRAVTEALAAPAR